MKTTYRTIIKSKNGKTYTIATSEQEQNELFRFLDDHDFDYESADEYLTFVNSSDDEFVIGRQDIYNIANAIVDSGEKMENMRLVFFGNISKPLTCLVVDMKNDETIYAFEDTVIFNPNNAEEHESHVVSIEFPILEFLEAACEILAEEIVNKAMQCIDSDEFKEIKDRLSNMTGNRKWRFDA